MNWVTTTGTQQIPASTPQLQKVEKKAGKRIGYNYIILKSIKESPKNDVVLCLYIKSLLDFGICVIKEGTFGDTKDKQGRDIKDRLLWQKRLHEALQNKIRLPRLLGSFEENGNYYLVLQRIRGKSLSKICKENSKQLRESLINGNKTGIIFLGYMIQLVSLLEKLHQQHVIHRDVTATNFMITPSGQVAIIDMELSYSLQQQFPSPPFQLGTYGYMSPEQEATQLPTIEQDTFSAAAVILQIWTGISPNKFTNVPTKDLSERIHFFIPDESFSDAIAGCLHTDPTQRPTLSTVRRVITSYKEDILHKKVRPSSGRRYFEKEAIAETAQHAVKALSSPLLADKEKGWFSENHNAHQNPDKNEISKTWYTSFAKGASGIIYLLSKAHKLNLDITSSRPYIDKGINLIATKYIDRISEANPGLYFGSSGIAATLSIAILDGLIEPTSTYIDWINRLIEKDSPLLGIQDGIAGQGIAHFHCQPFINREKEHADLTNYVNRILDAQEKDGSWTRLSETGKNRTTRGFAHGVAGITYFLLAFSNRYSNQDTLASAERGLQWLLKKSIAYKGTARWMSSTGKDLPFGWCDGISGIALTFLKAFSITGKEEYKKYATSALYNQAKEITDNNLSQYHGLTGLGEIYLEAFRILQSTEWLERAEWIAQVLMHLKKHDTSNNPYWLVDHERQPVAEFMAGNAGVVHFLLRYCYSDKIGFPLLS